MEVPSHKVVGSCINSIHAAGSVEWTALEGGTMTYIENHSSSKGNSDITQVNFHQKAEEQGIDQLYCYLQDKNSLIADVFLICLYKWFRTAKKPSDKVIINVDDILDMRGIQPKKKEGYRAGHRNQDRIMVGQCIEALDRMYVESSSVAVYSKEGKRSDYLRETKIMMVYERVVETRGNHEKVPISFIISFEALDKRVLMTGGSRQTATFLTKTLDYNPYTEYREKRLSFYLSFQWRYRMHSGNYTQPFKVSTLLSGIKEDVDRRYPVKTRFRLEKALNRLAADGIIKSWRYGNEDSIERLPVRKWLDLWLDFNVVIGVPDVLLTKYVKKDTVLTIGPAVIAECSTPSVSVT